MTGVYSRGLVDAWVVKQSKVERPNCYCSFWNPFYTWIIFKTSLCFGVWSAWTFMEISNNPIVFGPLFPWIPMFGWLTHEHDFRVKYVWPSQQPTRFLLPCSLLFYNYHHTSSSSSSYIIIIIIIILIVIAIITILVMIIHHRIITYMCILYIYIYHLQDFHLSS